MTGGRGKASGGSLGLGNVVVAILDGSLGAVKPRVTGVGCANAMRCTTESTCLGLGASSAPRGAPLGVL